MKLGINTDKLEKKRRKKKMKQNKYTPKPISARKFKTEIIPIIMEKFETLQYNIGDLHDKIRSTIGLKKERSQYHYNPFNKFNLNYYDSGLYFDNLLIQFDVDFLLDFKQSPIIKNELHISEDIVFFSMYQEESSSEFYLRNFSRYGNPYLKHLFNVFENFANVLTKCYNEEENEYIINNLNYLDLIDATDKLNDFCVNDYSKDDLKSDNNIEMIHESYLHELSSNSGLNTTIMFKLHSLNQNNPVSIFKISIHTESYRPQSYIKLFVWSEATKSWNILLAPTFDQFGLNPAQLTSINKPTRKYADKIIKFCIDFSQNFI